MTFDVHQLDSFLLAATGSISMLDMRDNMITADAVTTSDTAVPARSSTSRQQTTTARAASSEFS